jgi:hypothetical protein
MERAGVCWKDPRQGRPQWSHRRGALCFLGDGAADLVFFLLLLAERDLVGVGALLPSLSFKDFHHAARLRSLASGHPRMTTNLVVERSEPGCGLPLPSASRMFIILAGVEGEPS